MAVFTSNKFQYRVKNYREGNTDVQNALDLLLRAVMFSDQLGEEMRKNALSYSKLYDRHQFMSRKQKKM